MRPCEVKSLWKLLRHTVFHTISDFCHTIPLTQPLIIFSIYPWNVISAALKQQIACQSGRRSCVKIKRDFALILSGHQRERVCVSVCLRENSTQQNEQSCMKSNHDGSWPLVAYESPRTLVELQGICKTQKGFKVDINKYYQHRSLFLTVCHKFNPGSICFLISSWK